MTPAETIAIADLRQACARQMATVSIPLLMSIAKQLGLDGQLNTRALSEDAGKTWGK